MCTSRAVCELISLWPAGGDSVSARFFTGCPQVCSWLHGGCMVSEQCLAHICVCVRVYTHVVSLTNQHCHFSPSFLQFRSSLLPLFPPFHLPLYPLPFSYIPHTYTCTHTHTHITHTNKPHTQHTLHTPHTHTHHTHTHRTHHPTHTTHT